MTSVVSPRRALSKSRTTSGPPFCEDAPDAAAAAASPSAVAPFPAAWPPASPPARCRGSRDLVAWAGMSPLPALALAEAAEAAAEAASSEESEDERSRLGPSAELSARRDDSPPAFRLLCALDAGTSSPESRVFINPECSSSRPATRLPTAIAPTTRTRAAAAIASLPIGRRSGWDNEQRGTSTHVVHAAEG